MATIPWAATGQKLEASAEQHCRIWLRTIDSWSEFYCNCLLQTAACCWELCSRESGETSKMMPLPAVKTKTMSWKTLKHWGRRVISHNSSLGAKPASNSWSFALFGKKVDIWVSLMTPDPTYDPKASVFDKLEWKKTTSYWTFKFSCHAFIKPTSQKKNQPASGQRRLAVMVSAVSLMKFSTQVNCFWKDKLDRVLYSSSKVDCVFNILCNYHSRNHWWHFACNILACTTLDKWAKSVLSVIGALADFGPISARVFLPFYSSTLQTNWSGDC